MATQQLIPRSGLLLNVAIGDGRREVVELPTESIDSALLVANKRSPVDSTSYQNVAAQLLAGDWWNPRRIFVTSPTAGDGKTCTAFNLAWAMSARGASVLLVELNFERPRFSSVLGRMRIRFGVDCVIRRLAHPTDSVFSLGNELLGISAVKNAMQISDLKQHLPNLASFLSWGSDNYDWLILDCPPVLSVTWKNCFREDARPALLVVREQHTPAIQVRRATRRLGASLKGVLLNGVEGAGTPEPTANAE